jgi:hypothetical protein
MMMVALAVLGLASYRQLKVDQFPDVEFPIVTVTTVYPGASPETVEREVTKKVEEAINTVEGIKHVESTSQEGSPASSSSSTSRSPPRWRARTSGARSRASAASCPARSRSRSSRGSTPASFPSFPSP